VCEPYVKEVGRADVDGGEIYFFIKIPVVVYVKSEFHEKYVFSEEECEEEAGVEGAVV